MYAAPARFCVKDGSPLVEVGDDAAGATDSGEADATAEETHRYATLAGKILDERYQVDRRMGEGGMSYVYRGRDVETGQVVALKILAPQAFP